MRRRHLLVAALLALAACAPSSADAPVDDQWRSILVHAEPIELGAERIGALTFRGGLVLTSQTSIFGGLSGLEVLDDGHLVAISDNGDWVSARIELDADGALVGLAEPRMALMRDENGEPFLRKRAGDSEGLAQLPDGRFAVAFEQTQSIRVYDLNRDGPFGAASAGPRLAGIESLPSNRGLEALGATADGALIAGAEGGVGEAVALWRAPLDAGEPVEPVANYPLEFGFGLVSLDRLPDGDFVALERFYAPLVGARIRITRFSAETLDGEIEKQELAYFAPPLRLDNFESIAAVRLANGVTRLYAVSDDNFGSQFRTLLYAFDVTD